MSRFAESGLIVLAGVLALSGCGDKPDQKAQIKVSNAASTAAPVDPLGPRYEATVSEGIDFKRRGYPNFLVEVKGVSGYEPWGRWSDDKLVSFKFSQPLPENFTLVIDCGAFGPNIGKAFKIKVGSEEKEMVITSDVFRRALTYQIAFKLKAPSDTIQIAVPEPSQPSNGDTRKLGIGMISLKIEN